MGIFRRPPAPAALLCALVTTAACSDDAPTFQDARPIDAANADAATDADTTNARPGPVTALAATPNGINLDLSWQNPPDTDLDATLVVASAAGPVTFAPVDGTTYTVAQVVGTNQAVVNIQLATALAAIPTIPGLGIEFAAWAHDTAGQYSAVPATIRGVNNALGAQSGMIQLFQNGTVTVTQQPRSLRLTGTVTYDDVNDAMTLQLTVENQTGRTIFNLKGLVDSSSQGAVTNAPFPATGGLPMAYYGPEAAAVGSMVTQQLDLTGITGTVDPVVLTMHFIDAPSVIFGSSRAAAQSIDSAGSANSIDVLMPFGGCPQGEARDGVLAADAASLVTGARSSPRLTRVDLTTMTASSNARLATTSGIGAVVDVTASRDGQRLYAVLQDGYHANGGLQGECGGPLLLRPHSGRMRSPSAHIWDLVAHGGFTGFVRLVELDPETLEEIRRVDTRLRQNQGAVEMIAGDRAAVITELGEIAIVDLTTFTVVDTLDLQADAYGYIAPTADGSSFSVIGEGLMGYRVTTFDSNTFAMTTVEITENNPGPVRGLRRTRDGKLYVLYERAGKGPAGVELVTIDGTNQSATEPRASGGSDGFTFTADESKYYVATSSLEIAVFDRATHTELDTDGDAGNGVTPLATPTSLDATSGRTPIHLGIVTPF